MAVSPPPTCRSSVVAGEHPAMEGEGRGHSTGCAGEGDSFLLSGKGEKEVANGVEGAGLVGVRAEEGRGGGGRRWVAEVVNPVSGAVVWLGSFGTPHDAALAHDRAARAISDNPRLNFPSAAVPCTSGRSSRKTTDLRGSDSLDLRKRTNFDDVICLNRRKRPHPSTPLPTSEGSRKLRNCPPERRVSAMSCRSRGGSSLSQDSLWTEVTSAFINNGGMPNPFQLLSEHLLCLAEQHQGARGGVPLALSAAPHPTPHPHLAEEVGESGDAQCS